LPCPYQQPIDLCSKHWTIMNCMA